MVFSTSDDAALSRLFQPGCSGAYGNISPKRESANLSHRDSGVKPSGACATAGRTGSESVSRGGRPSHRVPPISSSIPTYSAVGRTSRLFVTQRSRTPCLRSRTRRQDANVPTRAAPPVRSPTPSPYS